MFSMLLVLEVQGLMENLATHGSVMLIKSILFSENIFETISNVSYFIMPAAVFWAALSQKQRFLKFTYLLGTLPLLFTAPIINKLGYKSLYVLKIFIIFAVILCLMKYLLNTTELYKKTFKQETDNQADSPDGSQVRRP